MYVTGETLEVPTSPPKGVQHFVTEDGIDVVRIHYTADPAKDPDTDEGKDWIAGALKGSPGGKAGSAWKKEMEIDFSVFSGKAIYPTFKREFHVAKVPLLPYVIRGIQGGRNLIIRGWDNTGLSPACMVTYINSIGQWYLFKEFCGADVNIVDFGEAVNLWCGLELPSNTKFRDIGDPAGTIRDSVKKSPAWYLNHECGIRVEDGIQTFKVRRDALGNLFNKTIPGHPDQRAVLVDNSCTTFIMGCEGGYCYEEIGNSGYYKMEPDKLNNPYSHVVESVQYIASRLFLTKTKSQKQGKTLMERRPT